MDADSASSGTTPLQPSAALPTSPLASANAASPMITASSAASSRQRPGRGPPVPSGGNEAGEESIRYYAPARRWQFIRALPVLFVMLLISALYVIYVLYHCIPLLQIDVPREVRDGRAFARGLGELITFNVLTFMLLLSYGLAVFTPPGVIPDTPEWCLPSPAVDEDIRAPTAAETKRTGERRHCKWCSKYKPDRVHHCRVCRQCVLKMDHHCPWIFNCVGWGNHKYFMLSLVYACLSTIFLAATMFESVKNAVEQPVTPFGQMVLLLLGETLDIFLSAVVTGFFGFHLWLVSHGMTTIEFCEKQFRWRTAGAGALWDKGCCQNFLDVFGRNPLLWLLPIDNREGDGLSFVSESSRLTGDLETGRKRRGLSKPKATLQFRPIIEESSSPGTPSAVD